MEIDEVSEAVGSLDITEKVSIITNILCQSPPFIVPRIIPQKVLVVERFYE